MTTLQISPLDRERSQRARKLLTSIIENHYRWGVVESTDIDLSLIEIEMLGMEKSACVEMLAHAGIIDYRDRTRNRFSVLHDSSQESHGHTSPQDPLQLPLSDLPLSHKK